MLVIAIVGMSGTGKDTIAEYMAKVTGWNIIRSYTTRPMREDETDGKEHIFVDEAPRIDSGIMASTMYGGYAYWTNISQFVENDVNIYIVDEKGLRDMYDHSRDMGFRMYTIHVKSTRRIRVSRGVSDERIDRDNSRFHYRKTRGMYDITLTNNRSMDMLHKNIQDLVVKIKNRYNL